MFRDFAVSVRTPQSWSMVMSRQQERTRSEYDPCPPRGKVARRASRKGGRRAGDVRSVLLLALLLLAACASHPPETDILPGTDSAADAGTEVGTELPATPSPDPFDYAVDTSVEYTVSVSEPRFVVPSPGLPPEVELMASNNNLDIVFHEDRLFLAFRTAPAHFASDQARLYVVSSADGGASWAFEHEIHIGADMREPRFLAFADSLQLLFFEAGTNPFAFEPRRIWRTRRVAMGEWSDNEIWIDAPVVPWDLKVRQGKAWLTSYAGAHYVIGAPPAIDVFFQVSEDGEQWHHVGGEAAVYVGGVSETAFEFDVDGSLWVVTRNEDGDGTGFGSHVCHAQAETLAQWECPAQSDPERYDSPELFRHGDDLYLAARRDVGGPYDQGLAELPFEERQKKYLVDYSLRPKAFALYRIDKEARAVAHLQDLPGCGDTAFAAVRRTGLHTFLLANYTSPLDDCDISWLEGQTAPEGTQIYLLDLTFEPER